MSTYESAPYVYNRAVFRHKTDEISIRDYFAAKAMQGMLAHHGAVQHKKQAEDDEAGATRAYAIADAMMKARRE